MNNKGVCRVCQSTDLRHFEATEMMYGTKETFDYEECLSCKSIQISAIPADLGKYYPNTYYSFNRKLSEDQPRLKSGMKRFFAKSYLTNSNQMIVQILSNIFGLGNLLKIKPATSDMSSSILDVGSGIGERLMSLKKYGFTNLTGIDPFLEKDIYYEKSDISIYKQSIYEHEGKYDVILLNHVFEHLPDPKETLIRLKSLLNDDGVLIIAMPAADSFASKKYKEKWVALDAPRHLHLFSFEAFKKFTKDSGYTLKDYRFESTGFQFWGSEQYVKGITLRDEKSHYNNHEKSIFSKEQIDTYEKDSILLNEKEDGDAVCYYLTLQ